MGLVPKEKILKFLAVKALPRLRLIASLLYVGSMGYLLSFPFQVRDTYISENALVPGVGETKFTEVSLGPYQRLIREAATLSPSLSPANYSSWLRGAIESSLRLPVHVQTVREQASGLSGGQEKLYYNVYTTIPAYKGQGSEALILMAGYRPEDKGNWVSAGLVMSLGAYFRSVDWLQKDIILLFYDASAPYAGSARAFIHTYYGTKSAAPLVGESIPHRPGVIVAGINIDVQSESFGKVAVLVEGENGQLPNLDASNVFRKVCQLPVQLQTAFTRILPESLPSSLGLPPTYNDYLSGFAYFMRNQALGIPTGAHGVLVPYTIDAITLQTVGVPEVQKAGTTQLVMLAKSIESTFRSFNNLLEHLHQSFYYYLLPWPGKYFSYGEYIVPVFMLVGSVVLMGVRLAVDHGDASQLLHAGSVLIVSHVTSALAFLAGPLLTAVVPTLSAQVLVCLWMGVIVVCGLLLVTVMLPSLSGLSVRHTGDETASAQKAFPWRLVKAIALIEMGGVCLCFSLLNFSFALANLWLFATVVFGVAPRGPIGKNLSVAALVIFHPVVAICLGSLIVYGDVLHVAEAVFTQYVYLPTIMVPFVLLVPTPLFHALLFAVLSSPLEARGEASSEHGKANVTKQDGMPSGSGGSPDTDEKKDKKNQ